MSEFKVDKVSMIKKFAEPRAEMLGHGFDMYRFIPTTGELFFWGLGPMPGIYDFLPAQNKETPLPCSN